MRKIGPLCIDRSTPYHGIRIWLVIYPGTWRRLLRIDHGEYEPTPHAPLRWWLYWKIVGKPGISDV